MGEFAIKVSPFGGSTAEARRCGRMRACGGGDAYNYSFVVQTNSEMDATHYSFVVHATIGKIDFSTEKLIENLKTLVTEINKLKPVSSKGIYLKKDLKPFYLGAIYKHTNSKDKKNDKKFYSNDFSFIAGYNKELGEKVFEVNNLSAEEGKLKDISLYVRSGEIVGIAGLVGAGRSELFQTIFGILKADSGKIILEGEEINLNSPWTALKKGIGYIPESRQTQGLVLEKKVSENITLPLLKNFTNKLGIINTKKQSSLVHDLIDKLDVRPKDENLTASQLSGGNQQKVVIAKWIATNPKILIVDEPTNGVDIGAKADIHKILRELAKNGTSIIVISSELPEILSISDRILVMRKGCISGEFKNSNLTQEAIMEKAVINK
mgnify:CR=1 FL=1